MTLRLSPQQVDILNWLKVPGNTPESYARVKGYSESTISSQGTRIRKKAREGRILNAMLNGLMAHYPAIRFWLKMSDSPSPSERAEVERRLQSLTDLHKPERGRPRLTRWRGRVPHHKRTRSRLTESHSRRRP